MILVALASLTILISKSITPAIHLQKLLMDNPEVISTQTLSIEHLTPDPSLTQDMMTTKTLLNFRPQASLTVVRTAADHNLMTELLDNKITLGTNRTEVILVN